LCSSCSTCLGVFDANTQGYKLRKPQLSVSASASSPTVHYSNEKWLSSAILTSGESQGVRRLAVYASTLGSVASIMHLWLFAPDLMISSSAADRSEAIRVVKVLYKDGAPGDVAKLGSMGGIEGEMEVNENEWDELRSLLDGSAVLLPEKARRFQEWDVGLLRRFTLEDVWH